MTVSFAKQWHPASPWGRPDAEWRLGEGVPFSGSVFAVPARERESHALRISPVSYCCLTASSSMAATARTGDRSIPPSPQSL